MKCNSAITFQPTTFYCELEERHRGPHLQKGVVGTLTYTMIWEDPRERSKLAIPEIKVEQRILVPV